MLLIFVPSLSPSLYLHMFTLPNGKWNITYPKCCSCQIFAIIYFASYPLLFVFILQDYILPLLLHNHNNTTRVLPPVHWSISLHRQRLPGSTKALAGANKALSWLEEFPNSLVLKQSGVGGCVLGICSCISICYLRPCQSPNRWSFPVLFAVLLQHPKHGFIPPHLHCQPGFPTWVSRVLMCMIPQTVWPPGL